MKFVFGVAVLGALPAATEWRNGATPQTPAVLGTAHMAAGVALRNAGAPCINARITTSRGVQQANARATWQPWLRISKNVAVAVGTAPPAELAPPGGQAPAPSARVPQTRTGTPLMPPPRRRLLPTSASPSPRPAPMRRWNAASSRLADLMTLRSATHLWRVTTTCRCRAVGPPHCASGERSCPRTSAASCRKRRSKLLPPPRCTTTTRGHIGRKRRRWCTGFPKCVMALPGTCVRTFS